MLRILFVLISSSLFSSACKTREVVALVPSIPSSHSSLKLSGQLTSCQNVLLSWTDSSSSETYVLTRNGSTIYTGNGTSFSDTSASPGDETYEIKNASTSDVFTFKVGEAPSPPTLSLVANSDLSIDVSFASTDGVLNLSRSELGSNQFQLLSTVDTAKNFSPFHDTKLDFSSLYSYQATLTDRAGCISSASEIVSALTPRRNGDFEPSLSAVSYLDTSKNNHVAAFFIGADRLLHLWLDGSFSDIDTNGAKVQSVAAAADSAGNVSLLYTTVDHHLFQYDQNKVTTAWGGNLTGASFAGWDSNGLIRFFAQQDTGAGSNAGRLCFVNGVSGWGTDACSFSTPEVAYTYTSSSSGALFTIDNLGRVEALGQNQFAVVSTLPNAISLSAARDGNGTDQVAVLFQNNDLYLYIPSSTTQWSQLDQNVVGPISTGLSGNALDISFSKMLSTESLVNYVQGVSTWNVDPLPSSILAISAARDGSVFAVTKDQTFYRWDPVNHFAALSQPGFALGH